jgi:hypothetical protein
MLYRWSSQALRNRRTGHVIVVANSVGEARHIALKQFEEVYLPERYDLVFSDGFVVPGSAEEKDQARTVFAADIAADPEIIEVGCVMIRGSE